MNIIPEPCAMKPGMLLVVLETEQTAWGDRQYSGLRRMGRDLSAIMVSPPKHEQFGFDKLAKQKSKVAGKALPDYMVSFIAGTVKKDLQVDMGPYNTWRY